VGERSGFGHRRTGSRWIAQCDAAVQPLNRCSAKRRSGARRTGGRAERVRGNGSDLIEEISMNGYQVTFFTQQDRRHRGKQIGDWLVQLAREMGIRGATMISATEGFGRHHRIHSAHFFELADQPLEVVMAISAEECDRLFARLGDEGVHLFYVKSAVEFGTLGENRQ
jgi:PII-like signaling protein